MNPNYPKSQLAADNLLRKYEVTKPFVNVFYMAKNEGLLTRFVPLASPLDDMVAGFIDNDPNNTIYVNEKQPTVNQVFTIAHELGHYALKHQPDKYEVLTKRGMFNPSSADEQEANAFALDLLVPTNMLQTVMLRYGIYGRTDEDIQILSGLFGVPHEAMIDKLLAMRRH